MNKRSTGVLAGIVVAFACAAPAWAGPTVTVRVEGENSTLLERTRVTLPDTPLSACGSTLHTAAHAIEAGTQGNWDRQAFTSTIMGESHTFTRNDYWFEWVDRGDGYKAGNGICNDVLEEGDEVLMLVDIAGAGFEPTRFPLDVEGLPATAVAGQSVTVTVVSYESNGTPGTGTRTPVEGATVAGGGASAVTGPGGTAALTFPAAGEVTVKATKAGKVVSAAERTTVAAAPEQGGATTPPPPPPARDTTAPTATLTSLADGQVFARRSAPRELSGTVSADPSGLRSVRLSIHRRVGDRCWTFRETTERFKRHRCGGVWYFRIGDRAEWSYLLPRRLPRGRYTIGVLAVDRAFNESRTTVEVRVK